MAINILHVAPASQVAPRIAPGDLGLLVLVLT
jgi:hypothetical protein